MENEHEGQMGIRSATSGKASNTKFEKGKVKRRLRGMDEKREGRWGAGGGQDVLMGGARDRREGKI